jgi:hypothetical protein
VCVVGRLLHTERERACVCVYSKRYSTERESARVYWERYSIQRERERARESESERDVFLTIKK